MGIYHQNTKIGYVHRQVMPTESGHRWEERSRMKLRVLDTTQTAHTEIRAHTDQRYALTDFSFRLLSSGVVFQVTGEVKNQGEAGQELCGQITTGSSVTPFSFPLRDPIYLPTMAAMTLRGTSLRPGEERHYSIFNPVSGKTETISVTTIGSETLSLKGQTQTVTKVAERFGGTTVHAWLDQEGRVVKEEAALGLVMLRESKEDALGSGWQDSTPLDLVVSAAIPVRHTFSDPRSLTRLTLKFSGLPESPLFAFPPRQQFQNDLLTITAEDVSTLTSYPLPQANQKFATDLQATPFVQSAHPRIIAQAQQILDSERDALKATRSLLDWTYTQVDKTPSIGMPSALEVLDNKKGDCNEHAVLFTALARAAGIPARIVAGVVYLNNAFYYHAWSEVWLGQWVAVDPTFHQFPADATHVKFVEGGPEQHVALLKVIGQIGMEIVEYR
jgi:hypothetical protein